MANDFQLTVEMRVAVRRTRTVCMRSLMLKRPQWSSMLKIKAWWGSKEMMVSMSSSSETWFTARIAACSWLRGSRWSLSTVMTLMTIQMTQVGKINLIPLSSEPSIQTKRCVQILLLMISTHLTSGSKTWCSLMRSKVTQVMTMISTTIHQIEWLRIGSLFIQTFHKTNS